MWCLETIIALNQKAAELSRQGRPITEAFAAVGINMPPRMDCVVGDAKTENAEVKVERKPIRVVA